MNTVEKTIFIWKELAKGGLSKPRIYEKYNLSQDLFFCPLCEECKQKDEVTEVTSANCSKCRMYNKWDKVDGGKTSICYSRGTIYEKWEDSPISQSDELAAQILANLERDLK